MAESGGLLERLQDDHKQFAAQLGDVLNLIALTAPTSVEYASLIEVQQNLQHALAMTSQAILDLRKSRLISIVGSISAHASIQAASLPSLSPSVSSSSPLPIPSSSSSASHSSSSSATPSAPASPSASPSASASPAASGGAPKYPVGSRCQLMFDNGLLGKVWMDVQVLAYNAQHESQPYKVRFLTPNQVSLQLCKFYHSGQCKFGQDCKFHHGAEVGERALRAEPTGADRDRGLAKPGDQCLALYKNEGLWYPAVIKAIYPDETADVCFIGYEDMGAESVEANEWALFPETIEPRLAPISLDSDLDSDVDDEDLPQASFSSSQLQFGGWEAHTKGFGSRMLAKFGYVSGQGLGRDSQGRTDPVIAKVVRPGAGLDFASAGLTPAQLTKQKHQITAAMLNGMHKKALQESKSNVFTFLNSTLGDPNGASPKPRQDARKLSEDEARRKLLSLQAKISQCDADIRKLESSLQRNAGKPSVPMFQAKLQESQQRMRHLNLVKATVEATLRSKKTKKQSIKF